MPRGSVERSRAPHGHQKHLAKPLGYCRKEQGPASAWAKPGPCFPLVSLGPSLGLSRAPSPFRISSGLHRALPVSGWFPAALGSALGPSPGETEGATSGTKGWGEEARKPGLGTLFWQQRLSVHFSTAQDFSAVTTTLLGGVQQLAGSGPTVPQEHGTATACGWPLPPPPPKKKSSGQKSTTSHHLQVPVVPPPPPSEKHKLMPNMRPQQHLFTAVKRNLIPGLGAVRKAAARHRAFGALLSLFQLFY